MSNIIKANEYIYGASDKKPVMLTIQVPLIDTGHNSEQKIVKMREELDELLNEFCNGPVSTSNATEELHDVIQVMSGYLLAIAREKEPYLNAVERVQNQFNIASSVHMRKMQHRAAERNWEMIYE